MYCARVGELDEFHAVRRRNSRATPEGLQRVCARARESGDPRTPGAPTAASQLIDGLMGSGDAGAGSIHLLGCVAVRAGPAGDVARSRPRRSAAAPPLRLLLQQQAAADDPRPRLPAVTGESGTRQKHRAGRQQHALHHADVLQRRTPLGHDERTRRGRPAVSVVGLVGSTHVLVDELGHLEHVDEACRRRPASASRRR